MAPLAGAESVVGLLIVPGSASIPSIALLPMGVRCCFQHHVAVDCPELSPCSSTSVANLILFWGQDLVGLATLAYMRISILAQCARSVCVPELLDAVGTRVVVASLSYIGLHLPFLAHTVNTIGHLCA
jgi:hypothetical protein